MSSENLKINILNQEYTVNCPSDQRQELSAAASYLDEQMRKIKEEGKINDTAKIAIMAALNISFDLLKFQAQDNDDTHHYGQLRKLNNKVDDALNRLLQLEI